MFSEPFIRFVVCRCSCINSHFLQKPQNPLRRDDFFFSCSENISIWSTKHFSKHHCYCCTVAPLEVNLLSLSFFLRKKSCAQSNCTCCETSMHGGITRAHLQAMSIAAGVRDAKRRYNNDLFAFYRNHVIAV